MHKRSLFAYFLLILSQFYVVAQSDEPSEIQKSILDLYNLQIAQFTNIQTCGHLFDGPASFAKQMERVSLDALLHLDSNEEIEIGNQVFTKIKESETILTNHWSKPKVDILYKNLIQHVDRPEITYQYHIIDSKDINAFSTLGGHIYICTGLIDFVDSMDELAFIIGHEIAHIDLEHTLRKQKKLMLASTIGKYFDAEDMASFALQFNMVFSAPFDQIDEYDADYKGYEIAKKAGYDTSKFDDFFSKLEDAESRNILIKLLSTHPYPSDRKKCLSSLD